MTHVNEKGSYQITLGVLSTETAKVDCMLKNPILKKSGNWILQLTDFILSKQPALNPHMHKEFMRIRPYENVDLAPIYGDAYIFTPDNCTSVLSLFQQLHEFCTRFSRMFFEYGLGDGNTVYVSDGVLFLSNADRATQSEDFFFENAISQDKDGLSVTLSSDLRLIFELGREFTQNFYIDISDYASDIIGLPKQIFHVQNQAGQNLTSSLANPTINLGQVLGVTLWNDPENIVPNRYVIEGDFLKRIQSEESIKNFDERMSIDVVSTFPISRKMCVFNGETTQEYLLGRFDFSGFRDFKVTNFYPINATQFDNPNTEITENHHVSAFNLTQGYPDYESNQFINGPVQSVNFRVFCRYIDEKKRITRNLLDLHDGFFQLRCLFTKKI